MLELNVYNVAMQCTDIKLTSIAYNTCEMVKNVVKSFQYE